MRATVPAGIRIKDLIKVLRKNGWNEELRIDNRAKNSGSYFNWYSWNRAQDWQPLDPNHRNETYQWSREVRALSQDQDPELLAAARISLGALGIISQVTIQCVKDYNLLYKSYPQPFEMSCATWMISTRTTGFGSIGSRGFLTTFRS